MSCPVISEAVLDSRYRFGFNGQERETEINLSITSAEYWFYDGRLGRRWNVDPITYPWQSSYATFDNNPIYYTDPLGLFATKKEAKEFKKDQNLKGKITYGDYGFQINEKTGFIANGIGSMYEFDFTSPKKVKPNRSIFSKLIVSSAPIMNASAGYEEMKAGVSLWLLPTGISQVGGTYLIGDGAARILSAPVQLIGIWTNNKTIEDFPGNLLGFVGFFIDNADNSVIITNGTSQSVLELAGDFGLSRRKLIKTLEEKSLDPKSFKNLKKLGNAAWQIIKPYKKMIDDSKDKSEKP